MSNEKTTVDITQVDREQLENVVMQLQAENRALTAACHSLKVEIKEAREFNDELAGRLLQVRALVKGIEPLLGLDHFRPEVDPHVRHKIQQGED